MIDTLRAFRLTADDFVIRLSSRNAWHDFFVSHKGDQAKEYEFYQLIDKLEREAPDQSEQKLKQLGLDEFSNIVESKEEA